MFMIRVHLLGAPFVQAQRSPDIHIEIELLTNIMRIEGL